VRVDLPTERQFAPLTPNPPPPIWYCHLDRVTCRHHHAFLHHKAGFHVKERRDGHIWLACELCSPTSFMFGIAIVRPGLFISMHAISHAQFDWWGNNTDELPDDPKLGADPTLEILHFLGYAPRYKPLYRPPTPPPSYV
jgi:hypothetical protein